MTDLALEQAEEFAIESDYLDTLDQAIPESSKQTLDRLWRSLPNCADLRFSNWDLQDGVLACAQACAIDPDVALAYWARKIYHHKLTSNSFANPDVKASISQYFAAAPI